MRLRLALLLIIGLVFARAPVARACGGGLVSPATVGPIGGDAQRIFISVHGGMTDVITQIGVPATTADYGVLIPVPSQPTLDPNPVMSAELATLDSATQPGIAQQSDDSGCSCLGAAGGGSTKGGNGGVGVQVSAPVTIGPVTAVILTAENGGDISDWLSQNGFAIPAGSESIVGAYAGAGRYFIAIRRSDTAATGAPTSVGIHFTLAGDERGLPLRFVSLGAASSVALTVFVVADDAVAPSTPFAALTLNDLDLLVLRAAGYKAAVTAAIAQHENHAFVLEGVWTSAELSMSTIPSIKPFIGSNQRLTRLSAILPAAALDTDVTLDQPFPSTVPRVRVVERTRPPGGSPLPGHGFALLAFAAVGMRRRRPR